MKGKKGQHFLDYITFIYLFIYFESVLHSFLNLLSNVKLLLVQFPFFSINQSLWSLQFYFIDLIFGMERVKS